MAQLENPFAVDGAMLTVADALALIAERVVPLAGIERIALDAADGRVLAEDVVAALDLPRFDNSAVDGYAVAFADLRPNDATTLAVDGRVAAGQTAAAVRRGSAVRIFTGAPMPAGTDTVFMQEDVQLRDDGRVVLPAGLEHGDNCRLRGEDIARGSVALRAGRRLRPQDIALAAALGCAQLAVRPRLRVAVFSTGDEIVAPGAPLPPAGLYDANRFALAALLRRQGCAVTDLGIVPDDRATVIAALRDAARNSDLIVTSGGVSTGEEDHVRAALESAGTLAFWRLAIKPGRPVAMGAIDGTPFVGLPGNPVAVFITFAAVVRPLLAALACESWEHPAPLAVSSTFAHRKKTGRREYLRVALTSSAHGAPRATLHPVDGAGIITSLTCTDGLVELSETTTAIAPGDTLDFYAYDALW